MASLSTTVRPDISLAPAETEMLQVTGSPLSSPREEPENLSQVIEEELETLQGWSNLRREQVEGTRCLPDLKQFLSGEPNDEEGFYPPSFWCSALKKIWQDFSTPACLVCQDKFQEEIGTQTDNYSELPDEPGR